MYIYIVHVYMYNVHVQCTMYLYSVIMLLYSLHDNVYYITCTCTCATCSCIPVHYGGVQVVVLRQLSESQGKRKTAYDHVQSRISSVSAMTYFTYMYIYM